MTGYDIELNVEIQACSTSHPCKLHQRSCIEPKVHLLTLLYFEKFLAVSQVFVLFVLGVVDGWLNISAKNDCWKCVAKIGL